jgi:hypothetical protein
MSAGFISELKRRNVIRMAGLYPATCLSLCSMLG